MSVKGIDISSNNGRNIDFHAIRRMGYRFVYIKVTEGAPYVDSSGKHHSGYVNPYAKDHTHEAKDAGLIVGAYCFASPKSGRTGAQEADYFLTRAREAGLLKKGSLRPVVDIEITALPKGKPSRKYDYELIERVIRHLGKESFNSFDGRPMDYTASWFWDAVLGARNAHGCPLWLAAYTPLWRNLIPKAFRKGVSIHQYTDKQYIPGAGHFDGDLYLGKNVAALKHNHLLKKDI